MAGVLENPAAKKKRRSHAARGREVLLVSWRAVGRHSASVPGPAREGSARCIHGSWWDDCTVLLKPTVTGSSSTLPCFLICHLPWVFGSFMKSQQSGHSLVPPGHLPVPQVPTSSPKGFVPSVGQGTMVWATAASSGEHRIFLRCGPFCRVARQMH